jgi:glycosyltransferase involved in cell wall biosynthesis
MRILHAIHDFLPRHRAGSEIYAYELCRALHRLGHQVHVLCAEYDPTRPHASLAWRWLDELPVTELVNNWSFDSFGETYASSQLNAVLEHALEAIRPDVVHIHNLLNLSFDLPTLAAARGIPSVATLHEYALLCPSGGQRVHLQDEHVCRDIDPTRCARCFVQSPFHTQMALTPLTRRASRWRWLWPGVRLLRVLAPGLAARAGKAAARATTAAALAESEITDRLAAARRVFDAVDLFVAPSPALGAEFRRFGLPADKLRVSDYGFVPLPPSMPQPRGDRLRIGFVGTLVWHKGAHVLVDAVRQLPEGSWELVLHGSLDTFPDYAARLEEMSAGMPIRFAGGFDRQQVADIYAGMDVLVVPSLWPENSPLVIHEAFMARVPVVGSRMGGTVDLIDDDVSGLLYDAFSADSLAASLRRLIDDPRLLDRLAAAAPEVKTIDQDAREWEQTYGHVQARHRGESLP